MGATRLVTERLVLRGWRESDRAAFHAMNSDPQVMATIGPVMTRAQSDAFMNRVTHHFDEHGFGLWCVEFDGVAVGFTGFMVPWFREGVEIGWRIRSGYWGRGLAPEAAAECLRHGFDDLGFDEIISFTAVGNTRSRRVMDKIGMERDPTGDFDHPGVPEDSPLRRHVLYLLRRPGRATAADAVRTDR
ncbi:MAG: GNAT family N-acetyltransferase [Ilumatobacteraceae bacterium]|nr:GNAT family N-acetyltransferase [Ilumatobacteraceae bacterium]